MRWARLIVGALVLGTCLPAEHLLVVFNVEGITTDVTSLGYRLRLNDKQLSPPRELMFPISSATSVKNCRRFCSDELRIVPLIARPVCMRLVAAACSSMTS